MDSTYTGQGHAPHPLGMAPQNSRWRPTAAPDQLASTAMPYRAPLDGAFSSLQRLRQALDLEVVLPTTVAEVRQLLQVERVFLFQFRPDWSGVVVVEDCATGCPPLQGQQVYDECFAEKWVSAYTQGRVQAVADVEQADLTPCHLDLLRRLGVRANLVVPLLVNRQLWGLLVAQHGTAPRPWQLDEVQMMQQLAVQVGLVIEQSEQYQRVQAELSAHHQTESLPVPQTQRSHDRHLESLGTLAGGLAHDLSDILTPILLAAEMLNQPTLNGQQQQWLNRISTSVHRGVSLVDQVLSFAQGRGGQRGEIQLAYLLGELVQTLQEMAPAAVTVTSQLRQPHLWTVEADPTQLNQVFMNLGLNSLEAMGEGGNLHIEARNVWWRGEPPTQTPPQMSPQAPPGAYVVVTVTDTGPGMTPAVCDRSREPFFTTRAQAGHSGLGLSTAQGLVKGYGGWLEIYSQLGEGTTVEVYLPAKVDTADLLPLPTGLEGPGALVLLVMAANPVGELQRAVLASYGYRVLVAEEGADAIALFIQHRAELGAVVLDLTLPTFNGEAMAKRMHQISPQTPIITVDSSLGNALSMAAGQIAAPISVATLLPTLATLSRS
ncbi:MAG: hypothetical protein DCF32_08480 [Leptolyngbya sp.]|nr:MAG: hypothetical protein DCF32_08480 [Leptolyngbya sp.]